VETRNSRLFQKLLVLTKNIKIEFEGFLNLLKINLMKVLHIKKRWAKEFMDEIPVQFHHGSRLRKESLLSLPIIVKYCRIIRIDISVELKVWFKVLPSKLSETNYNCN
jgi:excinuclease ABC subunit A